MVQLKLLSRGDYVSLFHFEKNNRTYFERFVPSRGADYFSWTTFCLQNDERLREQEEESAYFFLIRLCFKSMLKIDI